MLGAKVKSGSNAHFRNQKEIIKLQTNLGKGYMEGDPEEPNTRLGDLVTPGEILCNVVYALSNHRIFLLYPHFIEKKIKQWQPLEHLIHYCLGFAEKCKIAKNLKTTVNDTTKITTSTSKKEQQMEITEGRTE